MPTEPRVATTSAAFTRRRHVSAPPRVDRWGKKRGFFVCACARTHDDGDGDGDGGDARRRAEDGNAQA
jgi:hypothetical protein